MFKLLIADDEAGSREWLTQEIPWEANDICLVGPAVDGLEAWKMVREEKPEIILTDIRMPGMDGIELARAALALYPHTRILVISGYDEFSYAKACLDIGVSGYILKPTAREEILEAVLKERDLLITKCADEEARHLIQTQLENSIPLLREQFFRDLLQNGIAESNLPERISFLQLPFRPKQPFLALILEVEDHTGLYLNHDEKERQLIWFMMFNLVEANLKETGFAARLERGMVGALIYGPADAGANETKELANRIAGLILDQARLHLPCPLVVGIGGIVEDLARIRLSFEQAKQALRFHSPFGVETIATHTGGHLEEKLSQFLSPIDEERISTSLLTGAPAEIVHPILANLFRTGHLETDVSGLTDRQREFGWTISGALVRIAQRNGLTLREVIEGEDYVLLMQGGPNGHPGDLIRWWETQFGRLGHAIRKLRCNSLRTCIRNVKAYIDLHLAEAVTLSKAARAAYMSPSYLSRLFREQTGESFSEYVTRRKMEEARRLLEADEKKVYEVAAAVGYADPAYFGRVFRQHFNVTPTDLKKS